MSALDRLVRPASLAFAGFVNFTSTPALARRPHNHPPPHLWRMDLLRLAGLP